MPQLDVEPSGSRSALERLIARVEKRSGSAKLTILRPHPGQWHAVLFRDHRNPDRVLYVSASGDTIADALERLLADPRSRAATP